MTQICADPTSPMGQDPKANASALGGRFPLNIRSPTFDNRASFGYASRVDTAMVRPGLRNPNQ